MNKMSSALAPQCAAYLPVQKLGMYSASAYKTTAAPARVKAGEADNLLYLLFFFNDHSYIHVLNKYPGKDFPCTFSFVGAWGCQVCCACLITNLVFLCDSMPGLVFLTKINTHVKTLVPLCLEGKS